MADVYKQSFKQNYTNNIELSIFNCGLERCAPGQTWGPGIRDHYLIHLVVSGKGTFEVGGQTFEVVPGDLFFARPSQLIRYTADEQQPWEYSWVGFNGACAHKLTAQLPFTDEQPVHHTSDPETMRAALTNIYSSRGLQPQDEAAMVGYLYLFISALMKETSASKPHSTSSSSQYVLNAIKYIQFNYSHDISIDDVAKSVGVSRSHLYRVFMLNVGKSPIDYLTEYRINEACKLLRAGNLSLPRWPSRSVSSTSSISRGYSNAPKVSRPANILRPRQTQPRPRMFRNDSPKENFHVLTEKPGVDPFH